MFYTYILQSSVNGRYYVGATKNLTLRLRQHNAGQSKSTRLGRPWMLIHKEIFSTLSAARKREQFIKSRKSRKIIELIITGS